MLPFPLHRGALVLVPALQVNLSLKLDRNLTPLLGIVASYGNENHCKLQEAKGERPHLIIRFRTSADGGTGRSGGKWGKSEGISSGWLANKGVRFAGVRTSVKESSKCRSAAAMAKRGTDETWGLFSSLSTLSSLREKGRELGDLLWSGLEVRSNRTSLGRP